MGLVLPERGFLEGLRARADRHGALLIFDEIITWLRLGLGGAQARTGVVPDLTTVGKILGGGFPIAAFGGREDVMAVLAPDGPCFTGGTHAGMPFAVAMAHRVFDALEARSVAYAAMENARARLAERDPRDAAGARRAYAVVQLGSIVDFKFRSGPPKRSYDDRPRDDQAAYAAFYHAMRDARRPAAALAQRGDVRLHRARRRRRRVHGAAIDASLRELRERGSI